MHIIYSSSLIIHNDAVDKLCSIESVVAGADVDGLRLELGMLLPHAADDKQKEHQ